MFCSECGKKLSDRAKFCMYCGAAVGNEKEDGIKENTGLQETQGITELPGSEELISENDKYIVVGNTDLDIYLLNGRRLEHFKENYFKNNVFSFSVGKFIIEYPERAVMMINTDKYFREIRYAIINAFAYQYIEQVHDMKSFFEYGLKLYHAAMDGIASYTVKLLVASDVMCIGEDDVRNALSMHDDLRDRLQRLYDAADDIDKQVRTEYEIQEMNDMLMQNNRGYKAGGFGLGGVLGGIAAAELANAATNAVYSAKSKAARAQTQKNAKTRLDELFLDTDILERFMDDLAFIVGDAQQFYFAALEEYKDVPFPGKLDTGLLNLGNNTMRHVNDRNKILENLCRVLSGIPIDPGPLKFLVEKFYGEEEVMEQLKTVAEFLLFDKEYETWAADAEEAAAKAYKEEQEKKRISLSSVFALPDQTTEEIKQKIDTLKAESEKIGFDAEKDLKKLCEILAQLEKEEMEVPLRNALKLPENTILEIREKIARVSEEAEKIGYDVSQEIQHLESKEEKIEKREKEAALNAALQLPEKTLPDIRKKISKIKEEAEKIGHDVSEEIRRLSDKQACLEKKEREADYRRARKLPEDTIAQLSEKIDAVRSESEKIGINCEEYIEKLQEKLREKENEERQKRMDEQAEKIMEKPLMDFREFFQVNHLSDILFIPVFADIIDEKIDMEQIDEKTKTFMDVYGSYIEDGKEFPLLCYDDTLSKNARDGFMLTNKRLLMSRAGDVQWIKAEDIRELTAIEKLLTPAIVVNEKYKISVPMAGKKNVNLMIECIKQVLSLASLYQKITKEMSNGTLENLSLEIETEQFNGEIPAEDAVHQESKNSAEKATDKPDDFTNFIAWACCNENVNSVYCETGAPINLKTSKKYANAKTNFKIPDYEDIYLIYDSTILGGCRKGFAICTTGIYYYQSRLGFLNWEQFKSVNVSHSTFSGLLIGNESFTASGADGKNLLMILKSIQEYL